MKHAVGVQMASRRSDLEDKVCLHCFVLDIVRNNYFIYFFKWWPAHAYIEEHRVQADVEVLHTMIHFYFQRSDKRKWPLVFIVPQNWW